MNERESILFLLSKIKYKIAKFEFDSQDYIEFETEISDSFHKYEKMRIKIILSKENEIWFIKIELKQKRFIENHNNNNKNGASWLLWGGRIEDIKKGINEAESKIDYTMQVYENVYKFDLR